MTTNTTTPPIIPAGPKPVGATNTGLDLLVTTITDDPGLIKKIPLTDIYGGATAADGLNKLIIEAIRATGIANNGDITAADVYDLNAYIRKNHLSKWTQLHGDDEDCAETGFHLVQNDGATSKLYDRNAVNTVADGLYHLGFEIKDGQFLNEDGNANANVKTVAQWLDDLLDKDLTGSNLKNASVDPYAEGSTNTGLDQLVTIITTDEGLNKKIATSEIFAGATAADGMNKLIVEAIRATGVANNGDITAADVRDLNAYIRANHLAKWTTLHGDDEDCVETGFHLVQNDGATSRLYDRNAVNTVADGLYHLGFEIKDGQFLNEDGNANASVKTVAQWLDELLDKDLAGSSLKNASVNPYAKGTTSTGLDQLVTIITTDEGLNKKIATSEIFAGATAANEMNKLIVEAIRATGVADGKVIDVDELREINTYIRAKHLDQWTRLHGDDENGEETGFHLVQDDGATSKLFDRNAVNTVADGIYHIGFEIENNRFLNEDDNANASLKTVTEWLNSLLAEDLASGELLTSAVDSANDASAIAIVGVTSFVESLA